MIIEDRVRNWKCGSYMTLSGAQNTSLDELERRPGILASSYADWRPRSTFESTHVCSQHPRCATKAPAVPLQTAARPLRPQALPLPAQMRSWGLLLPTSEAEAPGFHGCGLQLRVFHSTAAQLGCQPSVRRTSGAAACPAVPPPYRPPALRRLWPGCWNGRAAPAAAARRLTNAAGVRRCESIRAREQASVPQQREIPQFQTRALCHPHELRREEHPCAVTSS